MRRTFVWAVAAIGALSAAACTDMFSTNRSIASGRSDLTVAFTSVPIGYTVAQTSYDQTSEGAGPFFPGGPMGGLGHGPGPDLGGGMHDMIGGGLGMDFLGGPGLGHDFGHGPRGDPAVNSSTCAYNATSGRVECAPQTERGLTVTRSTAYTDKNGVAQSAFDSVTTNTINTRVTVSGTQTRRDSSTSVVSNSSDRTTSGLAKGSTSHTINGTSSGTEVTTGKDQTGTFTANRAAGDTIRGVVVPVADTGRLYPTAGTVTRVMSVTVTRSSATTTSNRREVVTYDGTSTAKMVVTQDGTTKTCTLPLPFGRPTCQ